jgi:hypothetical protein
MIAATVLNPQSVRVARAAAAGQGLGGRPAEAESVAVH